MSRQKRLAREAAVAGGTREAWAAFIGKHVSNSAWRREQRLRAERATATETEAKPDADGKGSGDPVGE